jgi:hypothetical protein
MNPAVESALIGAGAALVSLGGTVAVAIVGFHSSRSTNQATIDARPGPPPTRQSRLRMTRTRQLSMLPTLTFAAPWKSPVKGRSPSGSPARSANSATLTWMCGWAGSTRLSGSPVIHLPTAPQSARSDRVYPQPRALATQPAWSVPRNSADRPDAEAAGAGGRCAGQSLGARPRRLRRCPGRRAVA